MQKLPHANSRNCMRACMSRIWQRSIHNTCTEEASTNEKGRVARIKFEDRDLPTDPPFESPRIGKTICTSHGDSRMACGLRESANDQTNTVLTSGQRRGEKRLVLLVVGLCVFVTSVAGCVVQATFGLRVFESSGCCRAWVSGSV